MPSVPRIGCCCYVLTEHGHPSVAIPSLLLVFQADGVADSVEQHLPIGPAGFDLYCLHVFTWPICQAQVAAGHRPKGEAQVVSLCRPLHESEDGLGVPLANRAQNPGASRHVVIDDVRDDPSRPDTPRAVLTIAVRCRSPYGCRLVASLSPLEPLGIPTGDLLRRPQDDVARDRHTVDHLVGNFRAAEGRRPNRGAVLARREGGRQDRAKQSEERRTPEPSVEHRFPSRTGRRTGQDAPAKAAVPDTPEPRPESRAAVTPADDQWLSQQAFCSGIN